MSHLGLCGIHFQKYNGKTSINIRKRIPKGFLSVNSKLQGGARGVMVIVVGKGYGDTSSNPGRDCISHSTNAFGKGMNPIILPSFG